MTDETGDTDDDFPLDDLGLLPPLNRDKTPAPPPISTSYGEEMPDDA
ncbi:hypothetical protein ACRAWB_07435 [Leifsonia poae]